MMGVTIYGEGIEEGKPNAYGTLKGTKYNDIAINIASLVNSIINMPKKPAVTFNFLKTTENVGKAVDDVYKLFKGELYGRFTDGTRTVQVIDLTQGDMMKTLGSLEAQTIKSLIQDSTNHTHVHFNEINQENAQNSLAWQKFQNDTGAGPSQNGRLICIYNFTGRDVTPDAKKGTRVASQSSSDHSVTVRAKMAIASAFAGDKDYSEARAICAALPEDHALVGAVSRLSVKSSERAVVGALATYEDMSPAAVGAEMRAAVAHVEQQGISDRVTSHYPFGTASKIVEADVGGEYTEAFDGVF